MIWKYGLGRVDVKNTVANQILVEITADRRQ